MRGGVAYYFVLFPLKTLEFNFGIKTLKGGGFISQKYKNIALTIHQDFKIKLNVFFFRHYSWKPPASNIFIDLCQPIIQSINHGDAMNLNYVISSTSNLQQV